MSLERNQTVVSISSSIVVAYCYTFVGEKAREFEAKGDRPRKKETYRMDQMTRRKP